MAKNGNKWVFKGRNSVNDRDELWEIDKKGKTIQREVYPFVARKSTGKKSGRKPVNLFNAFSIKASRPACDSEHICVILDSCLRSTHLPLVFTPKAPVAIFSEV